MLAALSALGMSAWLSISPPFDPWDPESAPPASDDRQTPPASQDAGVRPMVVPPSGAGEPLRDAGLGDEKRRTGGPRSSERSQGEETVDCQLELTVEVLDEDTDEVVPDAVVSVEQPLRGNIRRGRTDLAGVVHIYGLCDGSSVAKVTKAQHDDATLSFVMDSNRNLVSIELPALHSHHSARVVVVHDEALDHASSSETIDGEALARTRGAGLSDAIAGVAGVSTLRGPAGGMGKPIIRGHSGRRNMILVDGIRHEGQSWGIDHAPEVDPYAASRITVIKGASTTRYGSSAIGGVVLLDSRPLRRTPGYNAEFSTVGLSNPLGGGGAASIDLAPRRLRGLSLRLDGDAARHRAAVTPSYPLDNTGAWTWNAGARVGYLRENFDIELGYRLMRARLGICTCLKTSSAEDFEASIARGRPVDAAAYRPDLVIERPKQEVWHHLAYARTRAVLGRAGELHSTYSFQYNDRREFDVVRSSVTGPQLTFGLATHNLDTYLEHSALRGKRVSLVGSFGTMLAYQRNEFTSANSLIPDYRQLTWALYDVERLVWKRTELEFGARYEGMYRDVRLSERDYLGQLSGDRLDSSLCGPRGDGGRCEIQFHAPSVTLAVLSRPAAKLPGLTWRLQADSSARLPAIDEQFMNGAAPSFPILGFGSSKIGIERTYGGETTLRYDGAVLFVEGSGYGSFIDDYIYFVPEQQEGQCAPLSCTARGPFPVFAFSPRDAAFTGGELRTEVRTPRLPFGVSAQGAWVRGFDLADGRQLAFIPGDRYAVAGRYYLPDSSFTARGYLEVNGTLVARRNALDVDLDYAPPPATYALLGAAAGIEFVPDRHVYRLALAGTNLTNARYRDYTNLLRYFADEIGWSVSLRFSVEFGADAPKAAARPAHRRKARARPSGHRAATVPTRAA